jgi:chitinase
MKRNLILVILIALLQMTITAQKKEIVAYYPSWGAAAQHYYVKNIKTSGSDKKITVLNYAFVEPFADSLGNVGVKFMNPYLDYQQVYSAEMSVNDIADDSTQPLRGQFNQLKKLKAMHPGLKIVVSIGGWTGSTFFSDVALTPESREKFVNDCIDKFIYGNLPQIYMAGGKGVAAKIFDGFDFDWEFPVNGGDAGIHHNINDTGNLSELISLFRKKLDAIKPGYLLTAAIPARGADLWKFNLKKDQANMDWYNLMTYDFHGSWDNITDHHTNLLSSPADTLFPGIKESFAGAVIYMMDSAAVSPDKIVPGAAFYGRGWKVTSLVNNGLYQPGKVAESGFNNYSDLVLLVNKGYEYHWDNDAMAPHLFSHKDSTFWSFDDQVSVALKTRFAYSHNLRGLMFWEISGDDSVGTLVNIIDSRNMPDIKFLKVLPGKKSPLVSITTPSSSDNIHAGSDVIININEIQKKAPLVKVEYFADNKSLGYNTQIPFSWVWFNVPKGKHKLKAAATDSGGYKKYSKEVVIYVR